MYSLLTPITFYLPSVHLRQSVIFSVTRPRSWCAFWGLLLKMFFFFKFLKWSSRIIIHNAESDLCIFLFHVMQCFGSDGKLVLHYCKSQAWGWSYFSLSQISLCLLSFLCEHLTHSVSKQTHLHIIIVLIIYWFSCVICCK